ncbi:hypothetical protein ScPMuIL_006691 [Solemya velum]
MESVWRDRCYYCSFISNTRSEIRRHGCLAHPDKTLKILCHQVCDGKSGYRTTSYGIIPNEIQAAGKRFEIRGDRVIVFDVKDQLCAPTSPAITSLAYKLQKVETKDAPVSRRTLFGIENVSDDAALAEYRQLSKSAASMTVSYNNVTTTKDIGTNTQFFDDSADAELQEMVGLVPKEYSVLKEQSKLYHWIQFMRMTG